MESKGGNGSDQDRPKERQAIRWTQRSTRDDFGRPPEDERHEQRVEDERMNEKPGIGIEVPPRSSRDRAEQDRPIREIPLHAAAGIKLRSQLRVDVKHDR